MTKILLAGEGGQGIQTIAKALANAAVEAGSECVYIPAFGVEQRGTPSVAFITVSDEEIRYPRFDVADYVVILQKRAIHVVVDYISPNTKVIFDSSTIAAKDLPKTAIKILGIPATKYAYEKFTPRAFNVLVLGKLTKVLEVSSDAAWKVIMKLLGKKFKTKEIEAKNYEAFEFGREVVLEQKEFATPTFLPKIGKNVFRGHDKRAEIVPERCKGCGICVFKCPVAALKMGEELGVYATPIPEIDLEKCILCGNCRKFCPDGAINVDKE